MDKHFSQYILQDLIEDYGYNSAHDDMRQVVDALRLPPTEPDQVMIVGINGPTCAGKTSFTQAVVESLASRGIPVVQVAFDWFLYGRDRRNTLVEDISSERRAIEEVTQTAWDTERYVSLLRSLKNHGLVPSQQQIKITGVYDRTLGTQTGEADVDLPLGGYAIVEGVGILDVENTDLIDYHIRLDVNDDEILINRAITREKNKPENKQLSE
jgi:uridine kinase